mgnify:FL=1
MRGLKKRIAPALRISLIFLGVLIVSLFSVAQRVYLVELGDRITCKRRELAHLKDECDELECRIARKLETQKLEEKAESEFGLRSANLDEVVTLTEPASAGDELPGGVFDNFARKAKGAWDDLVLGDLGDGMLDSGGSI